MNLKNLFNFGIQKGITWAIAGVVIEIIWECRVYIMKKLNKPLFKSRFRYGRDGREGFREFLLFKEQIEKDKKFKEKMYGEKRKDFRTGSEQTGSASRKGKWQKIVAGETIECTGGSIKPGVDDNRSNKKQSGHSNNDSFTGHEERVQGRKSEGSFL